MSAEPEQPAASSQDPLALEYRALMQFLHLAPVGLMRARLDGELVMMNPAAAQLLGPLCEGDDAPNLFAVPEPGRSHLRRAVQSFRRPMGVVCENLRISLSDSPLATPADDASAELALPDAPVALGLTVLRLSADPDCLMVVVTDQSATARLERLQGALRTA